MPVDKHKDNMITVFHLYSPVKGFSILLLTNDILLEHKQLFIKYWTLGMMVICFVRPAPGVCMLSAYSAQLNYTPVVLQLMNLASPATVSQGGKHCLHDTWFKVVLCLPQINKDFLMIPKSSVPLHKTQTGDFILQPTVQNV